MPQGVYSLWTVISVFQMKTKTTARRGLPVSFKCTLVTWRTSWLLLDSNHNSPSGHLESKLELNAEVQIQFPDPAFRSKMATGWTRSIIPALQPITYNPRSRVLPVRNVLHVRSALSSRQLLLRLSHLAAILAPSWLRCGGPHSVSPTGVYIQDGHRVNKALTILPTITYYLHPCVQHVLHTSLTTFNLNPRSSVQHVPQRKRCKNIWISRERTALLACVSEISMDQ